MEEEVKADGEKDEELHEKFLCYCEKSSGELDKSVAELTDKVPLLEASIKEAESLKAQLDADIVKHKKDREDAKGAIESATKQREEEAAAYGGESTELKANIAACKKAITAISKGMEAMFLQSSAAAALRNLVVSRTSLDRYSSEMLTEFLSTSSTSGYAPASGEIVGILKQLLENMEGELKEATGEENEAIATFEGLVATKEKEIQLATESIESKLERAGETAVKIVNLKNDLEDAQESLAEDKQFLADLKKDCATAGEEYDMRKQSRADELVAIGETIKILNDDDALDLFKKTLPSPSLAQESFLQEVDSTDAARNEALSSLQTLRDSRRPQVGLIMLALSGKKANFDKVIKMIDEMVVLLGEEQKDDDEQKKWCENEFDVSEDKEKETKRMIEGLTTKIAEIEDAIATLTDELAALATGIKELDAAVAEATANRKEEHASYETTKAQNSAALQLLGVAKNRLNKFYNPNLYKAPPKRELTEEERIYVASGGVLPPTPAPGGIAGTGIAVFAQLAARSKDNVAPPPPPETAAAFKKKDAGGPIALIDKLANDLDKDMQANDMDEKQAQKEYEQMMADSAEKRATDSKTMVEKEGQKAAFEGDLEGAKGAKKESQAQLMALGEYIAQLHGSCDFLLDNFELRKEARAREVDAIKKAKAVLSGADYSFAQMRTFLVRRH